MNIKINFKKGFTLVEVLIYVGLLSLLMTSVFVATYYIFESLAWTKYRTMQFDEVFFFEQKIGRLVDDFTQIISPRENATSTELVFINNSKQISVFLENNQIFLKQDDAEKNNITNSQVDISHLEFEHKFFENLGHQIEIRFEIDGRQFNKTIWKR